MSEETAINKGIQERDNYNLYDCEDGNENLIKNFVLKLLKRKIREEF